MHLIIRLTLNNNGKLKTDFQNFWESVSSTAVKFDSQMALQSCVGYFLQIYFLFYRRKLHRLCPLGRQLTRLPPHLHPIQEQRDPSDEVLA